MPKKSKWAFTGRLHDHALTYGFGTATVASLVLTFRPQQEMFAISLIYLAIILATVVFFLQRELSKASAQVRTAITEDKIAAIARDFRTLTEKQKIFEAALALYLSRFYTDKAARKDPDADKLWKDVESVFKSFLELLCHSAREVLSTKKGTDIDELSANIKYLEEASPGEFAYRVWIRSGYVPGREESDAETHAREFRFDENRMYFEMRKSQQHKIVDDMKAYVEDTQKASTGLFRMRTKLFAQPKPHVLKFYSSCLVVPIKGRDEVLQSAEDGRVMSVGTDCWIGLFCIDSKQPNFFDEEYDLSIMLQLRDQAFSAMRAMAVANEFRRKAHARIETSKGLAP